MAEGSLMAGVQRALVRRLPAGVVFPLVEWRHSRQEPELRAIDAFVPSGRVAIGVGAWMGPWTRALARRCSTVHAIEPQPQLAAFLRKVVPPNVLVHEVAVAAESGSGVMIGDRRPGRDQLARLDRASVEPVPTAHRVEHPVEVRAIDDLALEGVGFVKIDVEGRELDVLAGASGLLGTQRPNVLIEVEQRHLDAPIATVFDALASHGYSGWFLTGGRWHPLSAFDLQRDQLDEVDDPASTAYINNFLFLPHGAPPATL